MHFVTELIVRFFVISIFVIMYSDMSVIINVFLSACQKLQYNQFQEFVKSLKFITNFVSDRSGIDNTNEG